MKRFLSFLLVPLVLLVLFVPQSKATSERAYQDYLYQFDLYRQKYSAFAIAKNEYEKFKSLASQTTALTNTSAMLAQRDQLLRAYLLLLNEKLTEDRGLGETQKSTYLTLSTNEIRFLDKHSSLVGSIGSLEDAQNVSRDLESHYTVLQTSIRQTIIGISLGQLAFLARQYDQELADINALITRNRSIFSSQKIATVDRWLLQIANIRSLYQQKIDEVTAKNAQLYGYSIDTLNDKLFAYKKDLGQAKQYLREGNGFMGELIEVIKYQN